MIYFGARCSYWTDQPGKLLDASGPAIQPLRCPACKRKMLRMTNVTWHNQVTQVDRSRPGYALFVERNKEKCYGDKPIEQVLTEIADSN